MQLQCSQCTHPPHLIGSILTTGQVMLTLACYGAKDAGPARTTGSGDINTKPQ
jgi:hypothetical protein